MISPHPTPPPPFPKQSPIAEAEKGVKLFLLNQSHRNGPSLGSNVSLASLLSAVCFLDHFWKPLKDLGPTFCQRKQLRPPRAYQQSQSESKVLALRTLPPPLHSLTLQITFPTTYANLSYLSLLLL